MSPATFDVETQCGPWSILATVRMWPINEERDDESVELEEIIDRELWDAVDDRIAAVPTAEQWGQIDAAIESEAMKVWERRQRDLYIRWLEQVDGPIGRPFRELVDG